MTDAKRALSIIIASVVGFFVLLGLLLGPEQKWRGLAGAAALLFFVAAVAVGAKRKARDKRAREEQPPVPTATLAERDAPRERATIESPAQRDEAGPARERERVIE